MWCECGDGGTGAGADSVSGLARSLIVIMGEMVVCWEEGVVVGLVERVEGVHYCL